MSNIPISKLEISGQNLQIIKYVGGSFEKALINQI